MIQVSPELLAALIATENEPVDLYELQLDSGTLYYSDQQIEWGGRTYLPYVQERSEIKRYSGGQFDNVTVTFSNVDMALAQAMLANDIEGRTLIVRKIDRTVGGDSVVLFRGPMERPGRITEKTAEISAKQLLGSIDFDAPARLFGPFCPWDFKGYECGYAGAETACDRSWSNCAALANTARFGAFRFIPHSGTFQYAEVETKRAWYSLGLLKRKKTKWLSANFEAVDDTPYDVPIPIVYGRVQMAGITIQHEDQGGVTKALVAFCIGAIENIYFLRANNSYITDASLHQGDLGGNTGQGVDPRFPQSYPYSLVAYAGVTIPSDVRAVDPAPAVTGVIRGRKVAVFGADGAFLGAYWSDNPVWCTRDFLTMPLQQGGMGVPDDMIDDVVGADTAAYCDAVIQDATNDQKIYNPPELPEAIAYKRYRSTGVQGGDPEADGPYDDYEPGVDDDTSRAPVPVAVKRFTMNVAIAKQEKAVDILFKKLLPSFRGYLTFSKEGKIQIRCERPAKNSAAAEDAEAGGWQIVCTNPGQWAVGEKLIASPLSADAEVLTIAEVGADRLTFTSQMVHAHAAGAELLHVAMAFDDSNVIGGMEYPLSDRVSSTNRITIKYVDAPAGFEARELRINDYEHQAKTHLVNNDDVDGSAIDSYFQAWRIGQWSRAKARDLAKFCSLRGDIKASLLEVGDVIAVSGAEVGLQAVPFRVIELGLDANDEVAIVGQVYASDVYDDAAPQTTVTVPAIFGQITPPEPPPAKPPDLPGVVTLGEPLRDWEYVAGTWRQIYSMPVTPPVPANGFDRIYISLRAPDDVVATRKATIAETGAGFVVDDDPGDASRIVGLSEPIALAEVPWDPDEAVIRVSYPAPAADEKWRIIVTSGAPYGRGASTSVVVDAGPPPAGIWRGKPGMETALPVSAFAATWKYETDPVTGQKTLGIDCTWKKPPDLQFGGVVIYFWRSDYPDLDFRPWTGICPDESTLLDVTPLPEGQVRLKLRAIQVNSGGEPSTYAEGVTPELELVIGPPKEVTPLQNATDFSMDYHYLAPDYYGFEALRFEPAFKRPDDASLSYFECWGRRGTGDWRVLGYPSGPGVANAAVVSELPEAEEEWEFHLVAFDINGRNRNGDVETIPGEWPEGTPWCKLTVQPPTGKLDGRKIANIPAAAFAAGLTATYLGTALPALPDSAKYPAGTPFILTSPGQTPKMYRVNAAGSAWTAAVDGTDIVARTIYGTSLVTGAVGTAELAATEILVGPGGARPIRFVVRDLSQTLLCMIGDDSSIPFTGAYFRSLKISPGISNTTNYIQADGAGITAVGTTIRTHLNANGATGSVSMGPNYYDPIFSFPGVKAEANAGEGSVAWFIPRGLIMLQTGGPGPNGQYLAVVKDPIGIGGQMVLYGSAYAATGNYVFANGTNGTMRADNGYQVGAYVGRGTRVAPQTYNLALAGGGSVQVTFVGGLVC